MNTPFVTLYTAIPILAAQCAPIWTVGSTEFRQLKRVLQWGNEPMTSDEINQQCNAMVIAWVQTLMMVSLLPVDTRAAFVQGVSVSDNQLKFTVKDRVLSTPIGTWNADWDACFQYWLQAVFQQTSRPSIQQWCRRLYHQLSLDQSTMVAMQDQSNRAQKALKHADWTGLDPMDYYLILNAFPLPALNQFYTRISPYFPDTMAVEWGDDICVLSAVFEPVSEGFMVAMKKNSIFYQFFLKQHNRYPDLWTRCCQALQLIASDSLYRTPIISQLSQTADALVQPRLDLVDRCVRHLAAMQSQ